LTRRKTLLKVKLLHPDAKLPTVGHVGEDLGVDLYSIESVSIGPLEQKKIRTGIAIEFDPPAGAIIADKSSMADIYALVVGKIVDAGFRGEIIVTIYNRHPVAQLEIKKGNKFAQILKYTNTAEAVSEVTDLADSSRKDGGWGSTGAQ
jgi:dUTP pyrophosphatase